MLAVPLHGDDVAPRFCSADQFLIAELDGGRVRRLTMPETTWSQCLEHLSAAGVSVLLCGGFNRGFLPLAEGLGIRVISGLAGEAERLVHAFLRDELERYRFLPCRGRRRGNRGARGQHQRDDGELRRLRGRKGVESCLDTTAPVRWETDRARGEAWAVAAERPRDLAAKRPPTGTKARGDTADAGVGALAAASVVVDEPVAGASERTERRAMILTPAMSHRVDGKPSSDDASKS
jgi:predicted Fe-Mo cluster-binding NifX family protein